jgi:hypothetical protein
MTNFKTDESVHTLEFKVKKMFSRFKEEFKSWDGYRNVFYLPESIDSLKSRYA